MCTSMYMGTRVSCPMENPTKFSTFYVFYCAIFPVVVLLLFILLDGLVLVGCLAFCFVESTNIENKLK